MERIRALVPWTFFDGLLPYNAEILSDNAMLLRACGTQPSDGSVLRSKSFLLFGRGIATLLPLAETLTRDPNSYNGYVMEFDRKRDKRQVEYWEVQCVPGENPGKASWVLQVSDTRHVDSRDTILLVEQRGDPGQFIFLRREH